MKNDQIKFRLRSEKDDFIIHEEAFDAKLLSCEKEGLDVVLNFDNPVKSIGTKAITRKGWGRGTIFAYLELPDSLESINGRSFDYPSIVDIKCNLLTPEGFFINNDILLGAIVPPYAKKVEIPEGITAIGPFAFPKEAGAEKCQIIFPKSLLRIEAYAFGGDTHFESADCKFKFNKNLEYIGDYACVYPADTTLNIPDKVKYIGERAFNQTERVKKIKLGKGVEFVGRGAFADNLQSVTACEGPFASEDGNCLIFKGTLLRVATKDMGLRGIIGSYVLPEGIETIDTGAIPDPAYVPTFPKTLKTIRSSALISCSGPELSLPDSVTEIENGAFNNCRFDKITSKLASKDGMYLKCNSILILGSKKLEEAVIPKGIEKIGDYCFEGSELTSIKFNKELKHIGVEAFRFCRNLKGKVIIPEGVESIEKLAFSNTGITELELPSTLKHLGRDIFGFGTPIERLKISSPEFIQLDFLPNIVEVPESLLEQYKSTYPNQADRFHSF